MDAPPALFNPGIVLREAPGVVHLAAPRSIQPACGHADDGDEFSSDSAEVTCPACLKAAPKEQHRGDGGSSVG